MALACWPQPCSLPCRGLTSSTFAASATRAANSIRAIPPTTRAARKQPARPNETKLIDQHYESLRALCRRYQRSLRFKMLFFYQGASDPATTKVSAYFFPERNPKTLLAKSSEK